MRKFDMAAAWDDSRQLMRSYTALTVTIAAVFLFLPALAFAWFGPTPAAPSDGAGAAELLTTFQQNMLQSIGPRLAVALAGLVGHAAILRLWLSRGGISVGESLSFAATMLPTMVAIELLTGLAAAVGFLLFILPAFYVIGRLALSVPVAIDRGLHNPLAALRASVALTEQNGWAIFFFLLLITLVIGIVSMIAGVVSMTLFGADAGLGKLVTGVVQAGFIAGGGFVSLAASAAIYRQLAGEQASSIFG